VEDERLATRSPDFEAFAVKIRPDQASFSVRLVDPDGRVVPGSERQVKRVQTGASDGYFLLPLLPLAIGIGLGFWRKSKVASLPKYGDLAEGPA
jgi:hypothetical protein